eukprot:TRINITY_DN13272_c0_g1_i2.p1 TRINITY_DN13272_c0_g1~~TRINITY_DN13272_c0_g1_i2.p1  ORF type:complete len:287 (-),score=72.25 TRINITY_DN13272_c0_g1_i2:120-980(-)
MDNMASAEGKPGEQTLTYMFFNNLLRLEEQIQNQTFTLETIGELVGLYAIAVEHYDVRKDPIRHYFMEKMQNTIANKQTLKMIIEKQRLESTKSVARERTDSDELELGDEVADLPTISSNPGPSLVETSSSYSMAKKKAERSRRISMFMKIESTKEDLRPEMEMHTILTTYENLTRNNDKDIRSYLKSQEKELMNKLQKRRQLQISTGSQIFGTPSVSGSKAERREEESTNEEYRATPEKIEDEEGEEREEREERGEREEREEQFLKESDHAFRNEEPNPEKSLEC